MILELLEYLTTPCRWSVRRLGYLNGQLGLKVRHRQCRRAWSPHLEQTRQFIRRSLMECPRRQRAVILGSGHARDVPLADLASTFREVVLVDIIHPWNVRAAALRYRNVRLVQADVTGAADQLVRTRHPGQPLPISQPTLFRDDSEVDFVVSVNLLSQLPYVPGLYLERTGRDEAEIEAYGQHLIHSHLDYLRQLSGVVCLITDVEKWVLDSAGRVQDRLDLLYGVSVPNPDREWIWDHVPRPLASGDFAYQRRVFAYQNWKQSAPPTDVRDVA